MNWEIQGGESVAFHSPWYNEETLEKLHMIRGFLVPIVLGRTIEHLEEVNELFQAIRQNNMAKSTVEGAIWDLYAKRNQLTLAEALGGTNEKLKSALVLVLKNMLKS